MHHRVASARALAAIAALGVLAAAGGYLVGEAGGASRAGAVRAGRSAGTAAGRAEGYQQGYGSGLGEGELAGYKLGHGRLPRLLAEGSSRQ